jgi:hypothetical protein
MKPIQWPQQILVKFKSSKTKKYHYVIANLTTSSRITDYSALYKFKRSILGHRDTGSIMFTVRWDKEYQFWSDQKWVEILDTNVTEVTRAIYGAV